MKQEEEEECCKFADDDFITTRNQANVAPSEGGGREWGAGYAGRSMNVASSTKGGKK